MPTAWCISIKVFYLATIQNSKKEILIDTTKVRKNLVMRGKALTKFIMLYNISNH